MLTAVGHLRLSAKNRYAPRRRKEEFFFFFVEKPPFLFSYYAHVDTTFTSHFTPFFFSSLFLFLLPLDCKKSKREREKKTRKRRKGEIFSSCARYRLTMEAEEKNAY